jgi:hypothetical protein
MRRRAAIEPVIGHLKDDHRMRRNHLDGRDGDRINGVRCGFLAFWVSRFGQFRCARRELKFLRTRLDRIIRDKIADSTALEDRFGSLLDLALRVRHQEQRQRGSKVYSLHEPEVECIGKGKARKAYEFGCKVSIATPVPAPKGCTPRRCTATRTTATRSAPSSPISNSLHVLRFAASTATRATAANYPDRLKVWISGQVRRRMALVTRFDFPAFADLGLAASARRHPNTMKSTRVSELQ